MRFRNYINRFNHGNKIFSEDDLWEMTLAKIFANEADIMAQNEDIGIPQAQELEASPNTQWVEPFVNDKGENDGGCWQSILQPAYTESIIPEKSRYDSQEIWEFPRSAKEVYTGDMDNVPQESSPTNDKKQSPKIPDEKQKKNEGNPKDVVLEGKVEKDMKVPGKNLTEESSQLSLSDVEDNTRKLIDYEEWQKKASKLPNPMSAGQYYGLSTRLADGDEIPEDIKAANDFRKYNDIQDKELKRIFTEKIAEMYKMDLNSPETLKKIQDLNMDIVMPKADSKLYRQIKDSETMQRWVAENYDKIKMGELQRNSSSVAFPRGGRKKFDLYSTINKADLHHSRINSDGSLSTLLNDGYDFEHMDGGLSIKTIKPEIGFLGNLMAAINNNAFGQQQANQLKRYLLTQPIWYSKEELEEILRKYYR